MSTNNSNINDFKSFVETLNTDSSTYNIHNFIDNSTIESIMDEYFPSFSVNKNSLNGLEQYNPVDQTSTKILTEDDFLKAINMENLNFSNITIPNINKDNRYFDINLIRNDFPILSQKINGKDLVWFDNAATTQKPKIVIDRLSYFYRYENSNVHRAAHDLAANASKLYEDARNTVSSFINSPSPDEIVFVRGTTEAINLVAQTYGMCNLAKDDEVIISWLEHHANIVPWQIICAKTGAKLKIIPVDDSGQIILSEYQKLLTSKTKIVAITHVSNALGTITPVAEIVDLAHKYGAKVLIDGAQSVSHLPVDVSTLDCDFYTFSGHKIFGPTGVGVLYAKSELLNSMPPYQSGGNMIKDVSFENTVYQNPPHKFEAGTGNIADVIALSTALEYIQNLGISNICKYEHELLTYGIDLLKQISGLKFVGTADSKTSILSFVLEGFSTEDVSKALNKEGIAVRAGHHCAQPILRRLGYESTVRPSLAFYNTYEEIDFLYSVLKNL